MSQLRAAVRLCRLRRNQEDATAGARLRAVYDTLTEGFTNADLLEARALLETLRPTQHLGSIRCTVGTRSIR
jgi:hypothetical protein